MKMFKFFVFLFLSIKAFAGLQVLDSLLKEFNCAPGECIEGNVPLFNNSDESVNVSLDVTDYLYNCKGENFFEKKSGNKRSNMKWIEFSPTFLKMEPHTKACIYYKIKIPNKKSLNGTYWCNLFVEPRPTIKKEDIEKREGLTLKTVWRYAMAFVTNVGEKKPDIKILSKTIEEKEALKNFVLDIENTGNCRIPHIPKIDIFNEKGKKIKSIEMTERSICPGCSIRYKQDLSFLKKGKYQMVFILDQKNLDSLFGTQYEFEIK